MKKLLLLIASLSFTSFALAGGTDMPYFGIHGGVALLSPFFTGFDTGAQLGYRFTKNLRVEGAFTYLNNGFSNCVFNQCIDENFNSYLFMANGLVDFHLTSVIDPFIGVGIGANDLTASASTHNSTSSAVLGTNFAYQGIAGLGFTFTPNSMFSVRYRYIGTTNSNLNYNIVEASFDYFI